MNTTLESICEVTGMSREDAEKIAKKVIEEHKNSAELSEALEPLESSRLLWSIGYIYISDD